MKCYGIVLLSLLILNLIQAISISKEPINLLLKPDSNDNKRKAIYKKLYNSLLNMVIKGNGKIGNISLQFGNTENERYMVALTKIKAGDFIVKIPEALIYSPEFPAIKKYCEQFNSLVTEKKIRHSQGDLCLQLWVLNERKNLAKSAYQNFIAFLPNKYTNFPIMFDTKDKKLCRNSFLLDIINNERGYLEEDYITLKRHKLLQKITKKEYFQAYTIFQSRTYQYTNSQKKTLTSYIPLVDLFNYKGGKEHGHNKVAWKFENNNFVVYAFDDIEPGSKLYIEYGSHSNLQFLIYYGFTYGKPAEKAEYNIYVGSGDQQVIVDINADMNLMKALQPVRHSFPNVKKSEDDTTPKFISKENELKSLDLLLKELRDKIHGYTTTTLEQDLNKLKNSVSENERNILRVASEERQLFTDYKNMVETFVILLNKRSKTKLSSKTSKLLSVNAAYRAYFSQINDHLGLKLAST